MPVYEFRCGDCAEFFDRLLAYDAAPPTCPACGGTEVRRLVSLAAGLGGSGGPAARPAGGCGCGGACACASAN